MLEALYRGTHTRIVLDWDGQRVEALVDPADAPRVGAEVAIGLPPERLWRVDEVDDGRSASGHPAGRQ